MTLRRGTPNISYRHNKRKQKILPTTVIPSNLLYSIPYANLPVNTDGNIILGDGLWDSILAPGLLKVGSLIGSAAKAVPSIVNAVKPLASAALPVFSAAMSLKNAANQAEQLRLMRELSMKNFDARLAAERQSQKKQLSQEQKDKISEIVAPSPSQVASSPSVPQAYGSGFRRF